MASLWGWTAVAAPSLRWGRAEGLGCGRSGTGGQPELSAGFWLERICKINLDMVGCILYVLVYFGVILGEAQTVTGTRKEN